MKIRTLKVLEYKKKKIYIRNFGEIFEYLLVIKGEIYAANIVIKKQILQKEYTKVQYEKAISLVEKMAEATIDQVLEK